MSRAKKPRTDEPRKSASKKKKKRTLADLPPQPDPTAPLDVPLLIAALQPVRRALEDDLLARAKASPAVTAALTERHAAEKQSDRTADAYPVWLRRTIEQIAAAWILSCVFVRALEDRGLLEHARIAGPGALDAQRTFLQLAPSLSEREYLLTIFREMTRLPAAAALFDSHDPVWSLAPSAEGARTLLELFRAGGADAPSLRFGQADTRYLGDLYQDLNESVRERYALLQTPDFVERFILDRTLERAIDEHGLAETDLIDPTCGSGHFLLGAYDRLFAHHLRAEPGLSPREAAHRALDRVYGADVNPYAVAIAKFRLTLSYLEKAGYEELSEAPSLPLHLAVADSLLYNPQHEQGDFAFLPGLEAAYERRAFEFEDAAEARAVLGRRYAAVVGNPPYITVKDKALRDRYRKLYGSAHREYSLSVPFAERFFQLARPGGRVGQITANSFMKREFGRRLIEQYFPTISLELIINASGAYIPGHGTPTVLLFGTPDAPRGSSVRAVLAKRGEPSVPADPAHGHVWRSIAEQFDAVGFENEYISVAEVDRASLRQHPWSLGGGGATELKLLLERRGERRLGDAVGSIGFMCITKLDDVFTQPKGTLGRHGVAQGWLREYVTGEHVRDWTIASEVEVLFPYRDTGETRAIVPSSPLHRFLWPYRTLLESRAVFGGSTFRGAGRPWHEYGQIPKDRIHGPCIAFAYIASHNHFVFDPGGRAFNRHAPILKLPATAPEEALLCLLAYISSSTACFWMKQISHDKGSGTDSGKWQDEPAKIAYEFAGTGLADAPLPPTPVDDDSRALARRATELAAARQRILTDALASDDLPDSLAAVRAFIERLAARDVALLEQLIAIQEELDWRAYAAFGLAGADLTDPSAMTIERGLPLGLRPFEVRAARAGRTHGIDGQPLFAALPEEWPPELRALWERRIAAIDGSKELRLIEDPSYKRRWLITPKHLGGRVLTFEHQARDALRSWLLDRIEAVVRDAAEPMRLGMIVDALRQRPEAAAFAEYLFPDTDLRIAVDELAKSDEIPYLASMRFAESGREKHAAWCATWEKQRAEDAGERVADIPVPPKYASRDYRRTRYWELRGKLDVPKERFISYPGCEPDQDGEPLYGWAGWDHAQRAAALASLYNDRKIRESWPKERLTPLLAGLLELLPWLKQWHGEPLPDFDTTPAEAYEAFLDNELRELSLTRADLTSWRAG